MDSPPALSDVDIVGYEHTVHHRLVSIDGCDGVGKSTLAVSLRRIIPIYTAAELVVIEPNLFRGSSKAVMLGKEFRRRQAQLTDEDINRYFLVTCQSNYEEIVHPALERGAWIVLVSSDLRALAFTIAERSQSIITYTREVIRRGILTKGLQPKYRCILESEPDALFRRVMGRHSTDAFDPTTLQGYQRRIASIEEAILSIQSLAPATLWRRMTLQTVPTERIASYMDTVAHEFAQWIMENV